ncbi:MAG: hypothetical protein WC059_01620 [Candidatus Paceibacterota bacterium]
MENPNNQPETSNEKTWRSIALIILLAAITIYVTDFFDKQKKSAQTTSAMSASVVAVKTDAPTPKRSGLKTCKKKRNFSGVVVKSDVRGDTVEVVDEDGNPIWVPRPTFPIKDGDHVTVLVDKIPGYKILSDTIANDKNTFLASVDEISSDHVILSRYDSSGLVTQLTVPRPPFKITQDKDVLIARCDFYQYEIIEVSP